MSWIEWLIIALFLLILVAVSIYTKRYIRGVSDWLVAGRNCGRYLGATAGEAGSMGAITIIGGLQASYVGGPVFWWTIIITMVVYIIISVTGWGIYRLRQTRVMTINELLERRYSRKLRIFCGMLCFISGVLNMGIFPIVSGRFIVYFCQLPEYVSIFGMHISVLAIITAFFVIMSAILGIFGGQISMMLTDFLQWMVMMAMFIAIGISVYLVVNWDMIARALIVTPEPKKYLDPFLPTAANDFGLWYCIMFSFRAFYNILSWAPGSSKGQSASNAREAKLMWVLSYIRSGKIIGLLYAAVACFAFMKLPQFVTEAQNISSKLGSVNNEMIRTQMLVPIFLSHVLPAGLKGLFVAGMIAASLGTIGTYFLSWASVFAQDVVIPIRGRNYEPKQHLYLLRWSMVGVAIFVYVFSMMWKETEYIHMYFAITGTIYTGGAGAIILGALYWRHADVVGAWVALIIGSGGSIAAIFARQIWGNANWWPIWLNGMSLSIATSLLAIIMFIIVSLCRKNPNFDLDALLNRDKNNMKSAQIETLKQRFHLFSFEGIIGTFAFISLGAIIFGFWYSRTHDISDASWIKFYKWCSYIFFAYSIPIAIWFMVGSVIDVKNLIISLNKEQVDTNDNGQVYSKNESNSK